MRKRQGGQAFILVLILLAIGALLIVPTLRLSSAALSNSQIVERQVKAMYAADGAQQWILWKLLYDGLGAQFTQDGDEANFHVDVCDMPVDITIVMRALEGEGGITLATDDVIRPMKTVDPDTILNDTLATCTYTIRLEQLSNDNSQGLDAIYDILPKAFASSDYIVGSSYLSVDDGPWESIPDPSFAVTGGQVRLRWPASGNFTSPIRDFEVRQVKKLKFQMKHTFSGEDKNTVLCNWVVLKPWDTVSGPQAPITVGSPADPGQCLEGGLLEVSKLSNPEIIQPGVETPIEYTITITNLDVFTHQIQEITDYLPTGFTYIGPISGLTTIDPQQSLETINDVDRWKLLWTVAEFPGGNAVSIASGKTLTLTFWAKTTRDVSGSYYNELIVIPNVPVPTIFSEIGVTEEEYYACYSWNTGTVLVPYYDSRVYADQVIIDANIAMILGGIAINSWQVY